MRNLVLTLHAKDIKTAVKADTYITGEIDKAADDVKNASLGYKEQAGDESYHEVKLFRTLKGALAKFEAGIVEFVETSDASATVSDTLSSMETNEFTVTLTVGTRMTAAFANILAHLAQEYIINAMLYYWWQPIKPTLAKDYLDFAAMNMLDVKRCLMKSAPSSSNTSYADISGTVEEIDDGGSSDDGGDDEPADDKGTLVETVLCDWDTSNDGVGTLPHMYGQKVFKLSTYDDDENEYSLEYSGDDTIFYYTVGTPDGYGTYNYSLSEQVATLTQLAEQLQQSDDQRVVLVWLDNKAAGDNTFKVYRK